MDPKENHFSYYSEVTVITPNRREASVASRIKIIDKKSLEKAGTLLLKKVNAKRF